MTPEAQRIAIAEACPDVVEWHDDLPYWKGSWSAAGEGNEHFAAFDPLNDLNAMHEAERVLTTEQRTQYALLLHDATEPAKLSFLARDFMVAHATAAQRAEAFLRTIRKWEEVKTSDITDKRSAQ